MNETGQNYYLISNIPVVTSARIDISEIKTHKTLKTQKFSF